MTSPQGGPLRKILILAILLFSTLLVAQEMMPFSNVTHSAVCADGNLRVRWIDATQGEMPIECHYNLNNSAWQAATLGEYPGEALVPYQYGQQLRYHLRSESSYEGESMTSMTAAYLGADTFPPALNRMGYIGADPLGDSLMVYAPNLDITSTYMAATDSKIYCAMGNASNAFPTFTNITTYNVYMMMIVNPLSPNMETAFAMVYTFNIAGFISPGLYKLGADAEQNPVFTRLGNIQSSVTGGKLFMACNIADLTADPDFGAWQGSGDVLALIGTTMRVNMNLTTLEPDLAIGDNSGVGIIEFTDHYVNSPFNSLPQLLSPGTDGMSVWVVYSDADGDFPLEAEYQGYDGIDYPMIQTGFTEEGRVFRTVIPNNLMGGHFSFSDNQMDYVTMQFDWVPVSDPVQPAAVVALSMPNPFRGPADIEIKGLPENDVHVEVFNLRGQKLGVIHSGRAHSFRWDGRISGSALPNGIYLMKVSSSAGVHTRRFAIIK